MCGNYGKSAYNQMMEVMKKLSAMESERKQDRKEIKGVAVNDRIRTFIAGLCSTVHTASNRNS